MRDRDSGDARSLDRELVSIITPVFNSERFISETIRSVQAQTYAQWEMLVLIDRGTTDQTASIVRAEMAQDPRVCLVEVPHGHSVSEARNHGFRVARGRYIAFLDADDLWLPQKLEKQIELLRSSPAALAYTAFRRISESGDVTGRLIEVATEVSYYDLLKQNQIGCLTAVVDQERTGPLQMGTDNHEDYALWLSILRSGHAARGLNIDLARYRVVPNSRSSRKLLMAGWRWAIYRKHEGLSRMRAVYYYAWYVLLTVRKHLRF